MKLEKKYSNELNGGDGGNKKQEDIWMKEIKNIPGDVKLTPKDKIVLDYILRNRETSCFMTSSEIACILGVSPSSVVRVSSKLGFENFSHFKRALQEELAKSRKKEKKQIPYEKIKTIENLSEDEIIAVLKANVLRNIENDQSTSDYVSYRKAAELIAKAERVFIVGFRACAGFASSFGVMLGCVRPGIYVVNGNGPLVDSLVDLTERDVVIGLSYERYSSDTVFAVNMAKRAGSHIVALTDRYTSPLCSGAEAVILNSTENISFYNSYTALVMAMEVLVGLVSKKNKNQNEERLIKMEEYLRETGQY